MSEIMGGLKEYFATRGKERLKQKLIGQLKGGIVFYLGTKKIPEYVQKYTYKFVDKNVKEHASLVRNSGLALVAQMVLPEEYEESIISDLIDLMGLKGVSDEIELFIDKPQICVATDANTIVCKNFTNLSGAEISIDGTQLTSGTDYTVGSDGETISLTNALASGEHTLVVVDHTNSEVFKGKIQV